MHQRYEEVTLTQAQQFRGYCFGSGRDVSAGAPLSSGARVCVLSYAPRGWGRLPAVMAAC